MKFLADMGISTRTVAWLREQGYDCVHLRDEGLERASDAAILEKAGAEQRVVLTLDLDFGYLLAVSRTQLPSVVIFRLGNETSEVVTNRLMDVLAQSSEALETGAIVSVTEDDIRVRHLPILPS